MTNFFPLPSNLPVPAPSKAALHLPGHPLPPLIELASTSGGFVDLFLLSLTRPILLFIYPRTAKAGEQVKDSWNSIPGARGCTPELCCIRDEIQPLLARESNLAIFGLSSQTNDYQQEVSKRLQLPFPLLSDSDFKFQAALELPTFQWESVNYLQRITLLLREGQVTQVQFPVFPPNKAAQNALDMLNDTPTSPEEMKISEACASVSSDDEEIRDEPSVSVAQSLSFISPPPKEWSSSIRSFSRRLGSERPSEWRNSLVAVDNETGEVVGVLAHGVTLSTDEASRSNEALHELYTEETEDGGSDDNREPVELLDYRAAYRYDDADVRPSSRAASLLGEQTFAPPPVPDKPKQLRIVKKGEQSSAARNVSPSNQADSEIKEDDDDIVDGKYRVHGAHLEAHRPDLLRDRSREGMDEDDDVYNSDGSGSTVGGPAIHLWKKMRGGKTGEAKRQTKKRKKEERESKDQVTSSTTSKEPSQQSNPLPVSQSENTTREVTANHEQELNGGEETRETVAAASHHLTRPEIASSHAGDEEGAMEMNYKGKVKWSQGTKKSMMSRHLQGNSVLVEFLSDSRIGASLIKSASPYIPKQRAASSLNGPDYFTPTNIATIPQTGVLAYIPVLPTHLLWFFGMGEQKQTETIVASTTQSNDCKGTVQDPVAVIGEDLMVLIKALSPSSLAQIAGDSISTAWNSVYDTGTVATGWVGSYLSAFALVGIEGGEADLDTVEQGDDDAEEWEWATPSFHAESLQGTPRPVYRRKRLTPSMKGNFTRQRVEDDDTSPVSIVHFDHLGIARRAYTHFQS
ncbi:hypothetical protein CBS101457_001646 [Exobasidium rhododendri]|nr:hypothetical protein CBS101457_001646 [Exobasidium rhododendri]